MPRTKFDRPRFPPINQLRAAILERKFTGHYTWDDLASAAHIQPATMRALFIRKAPEDWPRDIRNSVCRFLDIKVTQTVTDKIEEI